MTKRILLSVFTVFVVLSLSAIAFGQRTTGSVEGTVKDPKGAVVPGASVSLKGDSVGFSRTVQTNADGFYKFVEVPAGTYKITVGAISGFAAATAEAKVDIERTNTVDVNMGIGTSVAVVNVENDPMGANIDTADSKVQTTITRALIDRLPASPNLTSLLKVSPATRSEPLSGGFQVDGASGSENTFLIDGQPVENFRTGTLNSVNNIPTSLINELQIKTGGFEAEHGGASGGVVSIQTKGGSDVIHGNANISFDTSKLQPNPRFATSRFASNPTCSGTTTVAACQAQYDANPQITYAIASPKDAYLTTYPELLLSGPIIKKHLYFLGNWSPQQSETSRTANFYNSISAANFTTGKLILVPNTSIPTNQIDYNVKQRFEYGYGRIDAQFFDKLRGTASYLWNPSITKGSIPFGAIAVGSNPSNTFYGGTSYPSGEYTKLQGGRTNANTFNSSATYTPTSTWVINFRYGHEFLNEKGTPYALNAVTRYTCGGDQKVYPSYVPTANAPAPFTVQGQNCVLNFSNVPTNSVTFRDVSTKNQYDIDASRFLSSFGGRHEFKFGYTRGKTSNDVANGNAATGTVALNYGQNFSGTGVSAACDLPVNNNFGANTCIGYGTLNRSGTFGKGSNNYQALYVQDKWQPTRRLTLNLGMRDEKENLPSFNAGDLLAGTAIPGITQGWGRKWAPRLGAAYDLFGDGKNKIYGSYGWFYDRLKFAAPRGSFGGDFFRTDYFPILAAHPNYDYYTPARILGNWTDPRGGGNPSTQGGLSIQQYDFRIPSNLTEAQFKALGLVVTGVDPNLKSFRQDEFTVGYERELSRNYTFSARFTRKNVAHAMEDHAILGLNEAENYPVGNPGEGLDLALDKAVGISRSAKPQRLYKGLEFIFTKRFSHNYNFSANYTWSRLFGNYSGLASSDEGGRTDPGVERFFDYAINGYTAQGTPDNGLLATDRTHTFKAYGSYSWNWWGSKTSSTDFGFFQQVLQGTPQTTFITVVKTSIPLFKRGDLGRTPIFYQTDLNVSHKYKFGKENRYTLVGELIALNAFNNNSVTSLNTSRYRVLNTIAGNDIIPTYDKTTQTLTAVLNRILSGQIGPQLAQLENGGLLNLGVRPNPKTATYGLPTGYQGIRNVRFGFKFLF